MTLIDKLNVKIFADGADKAGMLEMYAKPFIKGFTTNPTLMRKAGIADYKAFAREILQAIPDRPISFEVFSDEFPEMERQALEIANWERMSCQDSSHNTARQPAYDLVGKLAEQKVKLNVTALMTLTGASVTRLDSGTPSYVSVLPVALPIRDLIPCLSWLKP